MTSPLVNFTGLASGFDYQSLVDAIIQQDRQPAARLETRKTAYGQQQSALATFRANLEALRTAAGALQDGTAFDATSATTTVVTGSGPLATVTTTPDAQAGSFSLTVTQLARAAKLLSSGVTSATDPLGGAGGTITINGVDISVGATDSLAALRDKINALNSGSTPLGVSATILGVSSTDQRLVLTSTTTGAAGISLADTSGTVLQDLGLLDGGGSVPPAAVLVAGSDAQFAIDGVAMTRSSNTITDVLQGVTLTLTSDESGAQTDISIGRFGDAARQAMEGFVKAYNTVVDFLQAQGTATDSSRPALYNDSMLRGLRRDLPTALLASVLGAAPDLATAASAGLSLARDGHLSLDSATFSTAFTNRYTDLRTLFTEQRNATGTGLSFVTAGGNASSGSWDVAITAPATAASVTTSGFGGVYDAGATPDTLHLTDTRTNQSIDVALTTGMTSSDIVQAIQSALDGAGMGLDASLVGNDIQLTHRSTGSSVGIALTFDGLGDGAAEAWSGDTTVSGTDVTGTINGEAATGSGDVLVGDSGTSIAGLTVRYTGSATGTVGSIDLSLGSGAAIDRVLDRLLQTGGTLDTRDTSIGDAVQRADDRIAAIDERLARRRASLMAKFLAMETAVARLQQTSTSFLGSLSPSTKSNG